MPMFSLDLPPLIALIAPVDGIQVAKLKDPAAERSLRSQEMSQLDFWINCFSTDLVTTHYLKKTETKTCEARLRDSPILSVKFRFTKYSACTPGCWCCGPWGACLAGGGADIAVSWVESSLKPPTCCSQPLNFGGSPALLAARMGGRLWKMPPRSPIRMKRWNKNWGNNVRTEHLASHTHRAAATSPWSSSSSVLGVVKTRLNKLQ